MEHGIIKAIEHMLTDLPPIRERKDPVVAGLIGFAFGGIGLGLYFNSGKDFVYPVLVFVGLSLLFPGLGSVAAMIFTGCWGVVRAINSGQG